MKFLIIVGALVICYIMYKGIMSMLEEKLNETDGDS